MSLIASFDQYCDYALILWDLHPSSSGQESAHTVSFKPSQSYYLTSAKFYLAKNGAPSGTIKFGIWEDDGTGKPATANPAQSSTTGIAIATLTTSWALKQLNFAGTYLLQANKKYHVGVYVSAKTLLDGSNFAMVKYGALGCPYTGWEWNSYRNSVWTRYADQGVYFYVYGNLYTPPIAKKPIMNGLIYVE
jgi:hypothetical protein